MDRKDKDWAVYDGAPCSGNEKKKVWAFHIVYFVFSVKTIKIGQESMPR